MTNITIYPRDCTPNRPKDLTAWIIYLARKSTKANDNYLNAYGVMRYISDISSYLVVEEYKEIKGRFEYPIFKILNEAKFTKLVNREFPTFQRNMQNYFRFKPERDAHGQRIRVMTFKFPFELNKTPMEYDLGIDDNLAATAKQEFLKEEFSLMTKEEEFEEPIGRTFTDVCDKIVNCPESKFEDDNNVVSDSNEYDSDVSSPDSGTSSCTAELTPVNYSPIPQNHTSPDCTPEILPEGQIFSQHFDLVHELSNSKFNEASTDSYDSSFAVAPSADDSVESFIEELLSKDFDYFSQ
jgi:hypothetical protein